MLVFPETLSDEESTIAAAASGDAEAFAELYQRYRPMIFAYSYRLCLNAADAQDIAQETFIKMARSLAAYRPTAPFQSWLYMVCTNTARDWLRQSARRQKIQVALQDFAAESSEEPQDFDEAAAALARLADDLREAIVLVFYEGLNHAEAARVLGCAETTVSWRIFKAKRKLKAILQRHD